MMRLRFLHLPEWVRGLSFRTKLLIQSAVAVGLALLLAGGVVLWHNHSTAKAALVRQLQSQADIVAGNLTAAITFGDAQAAVEVLESFRRDPHISFARVALPDGTPFATYSRSGLRSDFHTPPVTGEHTFGNSHLTLSRAVMHDGKMLGLVSVEYELRAMKAQIWKGVLLLLAVFVVALLIAILFSLEQVRIIARPIDELSRTARRVSSGGDYDTRAVKYTEDELGELTDAFNDMLVQIQHRDDALNTVKDDLERRVQERTAALQQSEERNRVILETALDAIVIMDQSGHITGWNPQAEAIFGWTAEEAVGKKVAEFIIPPEFREAHSNGIEQYFKSGRTHFLGRRSEVKALHRDGSRFPAELSVNAVHANDEVLFSAFIRDITERKRKEHELRDARDKAEAANKAKTDFLANMSHEIRTPMTAILGYGELLLDPERSMSDRHEYIQTIQRNGQHLLQIINDVLDLSKIEAGKFEVELADTSPCQIVADAVSLMRVRAEEKGLDFDIAFMTAMPATIYTDEVRLRQVLINLLSNAIKFTEDGSVRLLVRLEDDGDEPMLRFDVVDTGIGISQTQQAQLFKPFSQGDESMSRRFGGTGLGLAISKHFAELLGGDIAVESKASKGSTFTLRIATGSLDDVQMLQEPGEAVFAMEDQPRLTSKEVEAAHRSTTSAFAGARVLLVEDGVDNQRLISFCLRRAGFDVEIVGNGQAGVQAALEARDNHQPFDVILMDMQMPVMDGYQATSRLREKRYRGPIIALTAHAMRGDREKCVMAGCDDYASKPIDRTALVELIERILRDGVPRHADSDQETNAA